MITLNIAAFGAEFSFITTETNATRKVAASTSRFDRAAIDGTGYL
jgi:hypothetical protein